MTKSNAKSASRTTRTTRTAAARSQPCPNCPTRASLGPAMKLSAAVAANIKDRDAMCVCGD